VNSGLPQNNAHDLKSTPRGTRSSRLVDEGLVVALHVEGVFGVVSGEKEMQESGGVQAIHDAPNGAGGVQACGAGLGGSDGTGGCGIGLAGFFVDRHLVLGIHHEGILGLVDGDHVVPPATPGSRATPTSSGSHVRRRRARGIPHAP
jgi:hypothetical protein